MSFVHQQQIYPEPHHPPLPALLLISAPPATALARVLADCLNWPGPSHGFRIALSLSSSATWPHSSTLLALDGSHRMPSPGNVPPRRHVRSVEVGCWRTTFWPGDLVPLPQASPRSEGAWCCSFVASCRPAARVPLATRCVHAKSSADCPAVWFMAFLGDGTSGRPMCLVVAVSALTTSLHSSPALRFTRDVGRRRNI